MFKNRLKNKKKLLIIFLCIVGILFSIISNAYKVNALSKYGSRGNEVKQI